MIFGVEPDTRSQSMLLTEGSTHMRDRHNLWRRIILAGVLLCLILAGFFVYLHATRNMTVERNANYVADAASQTAKRIDDLLVGAENSISAIA
ncbi:MAG: hypothetical protein Q4B72_15235, partial [Lachnospiraceae bacterium]|nr:hypothetical protein [Lachnospiraceae bacterium]